MYKRTLAFLLALCMIVSVCPITALAAETDDAADSGTFQFTYINPLYEDVVTEEDLNDPADQPSAKSVVKGDTEYSTTIEEAGASMRRWLRDRYEDVYVSYAMAESEFSEEAVKALATDIFNSALAHTGKPTEGDYLMWQYGGWKCSVTPERSDGVYYLEIAYTLTYYTDADQEMEVTEAVDELLDELVVSGMTDYQKVKAAYDWICANVTYDNANLNDNSYTLKYTAYAALMNRTAVCQGYALLLYRLALEMGVDCRLIPGTASGEAHGWNILKLSGRYYNADSTWDAGNTEYSWFLLTEESFTRHLRDEEYDTDEFHNTYLMSDSDYAPTEKDLTVPDEGDEDDDNTEVPEPDGTVIDSGSWGDNLTWTLSENYILTISGTGEMSELEDDEVWPWEKYAADIVGVNVEDGVTSLAGFCFSGFKKITTVTLPDSIKEIEWAVFLNCTALKSVTLPAGLTEIAAETFRGCTSLKSIDIPSGVTELDDYAFYDCTALTSIVIPENVDTIGEECFAGCRSLTTVKFMGDAPQFGQNSFYAVKATCYYPVDDTWTENKLSNHGGTLTWVSYEKELVTDGSCGENVTWHYDQENTTLTISGTGAMEDYSSRQLPLWREEKYPITKLVVESGVTSIGSYSFNGCSNLASVTLPETLTSIGNLAFAVNDALTTVNLPAGVTYIGEFAFDNCSNLAEVKMPESLTAIGMYAFHNTAITSIVIPAGVTSLSDYTFANCTSLKEVTLREGLVYAGDGTFNGCTALTSITIPSTVTGIGMDYFMDCESLKSVYFPGDAPDFSSGVFANVTATVYYPAGNATWTADKMKNYDGTLTWTAYCPDGCTYKAAVVEVTCTEPGGTYYTCTACGAVVVENETPALGHNYVDCVCTRCGEDEPIMSPSLLAPENVPSTGKIKLAWEAVQNAVSYNVYRSSEKYDGYVLIGNVEETSMVDNSADAGETYYYCVTAVSKNGKESELPEDFDNYILKWTCDLAQPQITLSNVASTGKIKVSWEPVDGATKYSVYRSLTGEDGSWTCLSSSVTKTSATNTKDIVAGQKYYYKVKALCDVPEAASAESAVKALVCDLAQPQITLSNVASTGNIKVSWEPVEGATKYQVYRSLTGEDGSWTCLSSSVTKTSATNTKDIVAGQKYYYKVRALCDVSEAASAESAVKARVCDLAQPKVTLSNVASTGKIKVSWEPVEGATKYQVYRSLTGEDGSWTCLSSSVTKTSAINTKDVVTGQKYYYKVRALCDVSAAASAYSSAKARVCDLPQPVVTISLTSSGKPRLSWDAVEGAVKYEVYRSTTGEDDSWTCLSSKVTKTSVTNNKDVEVGVTYYYKVVAVAKKTSANSASSEVVFINCTSADISGSTVEKSVIDRINEYRERDGLEAVKWYTEGEMAAKIRTAELTVSFDICRPDGSSPETLWEAYEIYCECIGSNFRDAAGFVDTMMKTEDSAAICLDEAWTYAVAARNGNCWVVMFGAEDF